MSEPKPHRIVLTVNGKILEGFESGSVHLTMQDPTNTFDLEYVADGKKPGSRAIFCGDECALAIDAGGGLEKLIEGYVDTCEDEDTAEVIRLRCSGRSKAADLVDCSAINKPGRWTKADLKKIANEIASPFGVDVVIEGSVGDKFETFSVTKGETPYEAIQRAAHKRGLFVFSVGKDLVIAKAGSKSSGTTLERGKNNVVSVTRSDSWYARYSEYIFRGQVRATDENFGKNASQLKNSVKDATITRYRPLLLQTEAGTAADLKARAELERNQRAGRGEVFTVVVDGWGTASNKPWRANTTVTLKSDVLAVDATLLVVDVRYAFAPSQPREAVLTLMRPEAFDTQKTYPKTKRAQSTTGLAAPTGVT